MRTDLSASDIEQAGDLAVNASRFRRHRRASGLSPSPVTFRGGSISALQSDLRCHHCRGCGGPDQDTHVAIYNKAQTIMAEDAPILQLCFFVTPYEVKPYVSGLTVSPLDNWLPGAQVYETVQT
jgi:hypothetical protein